MPKRRGGSIHAARSGPAATMLGSAVAAQEWAMCLGGDMLEGINALWDIGLDDATAKYDARQALYAVDELERLLEWGCLEPKTAELLSEVLRVNRVAIAELRAAMRRSA